MFLFHKYIVFNCRKFGLVFILLAVASLAMANDCADSAKTVKRNANRVTIADAAEDNYDVKYLKFDLNLDDTSIYVSGNVSTTAKVVAANMSVYAFELNSLMTIDSAKVNGQILPVTLTGNTIRKINLPIALNNGAMFAAQIFYHGYAPVGSGFFNGLTHAKTNKGTDIVYSVSDPYAAQVWWPCKQSITDKIDSVDMYITVPRGRYDGSNGLLLSIDSTSRPGFWKHHWQTHYLIDYYLISVAIGPYAIDTAYVHFTGSNDSMLVQNFFLDTVTFYPAYKTNFDSVSLMVNYFSSLFGRYPFWKEKIGYCYSTLSGGMEHQTMITIGTPNTTTIAHELCHQWFGDHVTYARWADVWLSEGFAKYSEQLYLSHFWNNDAAKEQRRMDYNNVMSVAGGSVYVTDTSSDVTLFDYRLVYRKAAAVVHMLRYLAPEDSLFFNALRMYQQTYAFGNASTADMKAIVENVYGKNLDTFFNQWIYGQGYPKYAISWNQIGNSVFVKLVQTTSFPSSVPLFSTPLELQLRATGIDTIVRVYNNLDTQVYSFNWAPQVSTIGLEPNLWTLCKLNGLVKRDNTLGITNTIASSKVQVFPNPSKNYWQITDLPEHVQLVLINMDGRTVWSGESDGDTTRIPASRLAPGNYVLKLKDSGNENYEGVILTRL